MRNRSFEYWIALFFVVLLLNTAYIAAFSSATVPYMTNVLGHPIPGDVLGVAVLFVVRRTGLLTRAPVALGFLLVAFLLASLWRSSATFAPTPGCFGPISRLRNRCISSDSFRPRESGASWRRLGKDPVVNSIEVTWPSGTKQKFAGVPANQLVTIDEARGILK